MSRQYRSNNPRIRPEVRLERYTDATIEAVEFELAETTVGGRNAALNRAAFSLGQACASGLDVREDEARLCLRQACELNGYIGECSSHEFESTFRSGWHGGLKKPRALPDGIRSIVRTGGDVPGGNRRAPRPRPEYESASLVQECFPNYPSNAEVLELWLKALPITADKEVSDWMQNVRGLDPEHIEKHNLARVITKAQRMPHWARFGGKTWLESGHRLIVPCWTPYRPGELGTLVTVRARFVAAPGRDCKAKCTAPYNRAESYSVKQTIYANWIAMAALTHGQGWLGKLPCGRGVQPVVVIAEGEIDFFDDCKTYGDTMPVLGIYQGALCEDILGLIPDGHTVMIRTDDDPAGAKYAEKIIKSLRDRCDVRDINRSNR